MFVVGPASNVIKPKAALVVAEFYEVRARPEAEDAQDLTLYRSARAGRRQEAP